MALEFPNQSRSYDARRRVVHFWGHDNVIETAFTVNAEALNRIEPGVGQDEDGLLGAFDRRRALIEKSAAKIYARGGKGSYALTPEHF